MPIVLKIDPSKDMADVIIRLARADLPITSVSMEFRTIQIDADIDALATVEIVSGVTSIDVIPNHTQACRIDTSTPYPAPRVFKTSDDFELDAGFTRTSVN